MKILIVMSQFYQLGGAERLDIDLATDLNKRGIQADILSIYTSDLPGVAEATQDLRDNGIPNVHFLGLGVHSSFIRMISAIFKLRKLLKQKEYDIVTTSTFSPMFLAIWATWGLRTRYLAGIHQTYDVSRDTSFRYMLMRASALIRRGIRYYAISDFTAAHWIKFSRTPQKNIRRIYNAVQDIFFEAVQDRDGIIKKLGLPQNARIILYVGRLASCKGIDTVLDALGSLLVERNLVLLYIGTPDFNFPGTREMLVEMEKKIEDNQWSDRIKFLGFRKDIPRLMASANLLAHPTTMEGFGLTLVEAMAAGLPIVASDAEAIPEVLAGSKSLLVPPNDPKALRASILKILALDSEELGSTIESGRSLAQNFRSELRTKEMIRLFEDIL